MRIPIAMKVTIIHHFRILQRCRVASEWDASRAKFLKILHQICMTGSDGEETVEPDGGESTSESDEIDDADDQTNAKSTGEAAAQGDVPAWL